MRPDALDAARVLALALLAVAGVSFLASAGVPGDVAGLVQQALFLAVPLAYARLTKLPPLAATGFLKVGMRRLGLVILMSLASLWLLKALSDLQPTVYRSVGLEEKVTAEEREIQRSVERVRDRGRVWPLLLFVVASPVCEEVLFRGIVLRGMAVRFGSAAAVGMTAVLFALMHQTLIQMALMLFLGVYFGTVVLLTGSLWPGIVAHAINNAAVLSLTHRYGQQLQALPTPWWMIVLSAAVFGLSLALLAADRPRPVEGGGRP